MSVRNSIRDAIRSAIGLVEEVFNPQTLFRNGEQGVWYDPSDTTTLFQDSAGTTPVTASGQPVGLMLDKSKGLVLGPELVTNGTFDTGTSGWTPLNSILSFDAGTLRITEDGVNAPGEARQAVATVVGKSYIFTYQFIHTGSSNGRVFLGSVVSGGSSLGATATLTTSVASGSFVFVADSVSTLLRLQASTTAGGSDFANYDNISVRELPGNHATQPTAGSRPIYRRGDSRGVVNLLRWSEDFSNAAWIKNRCTVAPNNVAGSDGTLSADTVTATETNPNGMVVVGSVGVIGQTVAVATLRIKKGTGDHCLITLFDGTANGVRHWFNLSTGAVAGTNTIGSGWSKQGATISPAANGYYDVSFAVNKPAGVVLTSAIYPSVSANLTFGVTVGDVGYLERAQLNLGPTALPYQRNDSRLGGVATGASTDLHWLETDGVDDGMVTGNIDFTGTDKVSVFAGVRKLSDAAFGIVAELSADNNTNNGTLNLYADKAPRWVWSSKGSANAGVTSSDSYSSPITSIITGTGDISGDRAIMRINGELAASSSVDQGTGNFGNHPLYLFRRGGSSLPFNGWFYGLAITGRLATVATETVATERFLAAKSAVVIP